MNRRTICMLENAISYVARERYIDLVKVIMIILWR